MEVKQNHGGKTKPAQSSGSTECVSIAAPSLYEGCRKRGGGSKWKKGVRKEKGIKKGKRGVEEKLNGVLSEAHRHNTTG